MRLTRKQSDLLRLQPVRVGTHPANWQARSCTKLVALGLAERGRWYTPGYDCIRLTELGRRAITASAGELLVAVPEEESGAESIIATRPK